MKIRYFWGGGVWLVSGERRTGASEEHGKHLSKTRKDKSIPNPKTTWVKEGGSILLQNVVLIVELASQYSDEHSIIEGGQKGR